MKSLCFRSGLLLQFLFLFICCLIILTSDSAIGEDEPESSITDLNEWSNNPEGSITVVWKANDDDFDISTIYFWVCHAEDSNSCKNNAFNEWKLVESHVLTEPKKDVEGNTPLLWNVIFSKLGSTETEGAYKIITCSVNGNGTNEYGD